MRSIITTMGICALLTGAPCLMAQETEKAQSPGLKAQETREVKATVQKVDKDTRQVTLKKDDGTVFTVKAPEAVRNFDQIKVGDIVTAKYFQSVAISVRKSDEPPSATGREAVATAPQGEKPAGVEAETITISATIKKINRDTREVTLEGPEGGTRVVKVPEDMKKFDQLNEGDQVVVRATEALAISVSSPEK